MACILVGSIVLLEIGRDFAGYRIERLLGRGGMGDVYLAHKPDLGRDTALKVLPGLAIENEDAISRFRQEARAVASLEHEHIITLYDYGISEGRPWMALRFIDGGDLHRRLNAYPLLPEEGIEIFRQIASALDYAHRQGVIHRDLKPHNILLSSDGKAFLADFGIAKLSQHELVKTITGAVIGTPSYMSPEQVLGHALSPASDIYSFTVICFEWLTGSRPFIAAMPLSIMMGIVNEAPPEKLLKHLNPATAVVLRRGLAKNPSDRFESAIEFIEALSETLLNVTRKSTPITGREKKPQIAIPQNMPSVVSEVFNKSVLEIKFSKIQITELPHKIGRFTLHEHISAGSSGHLYKAWDPTRGGLVAIKIISSDAVSTKERMIRGSKIWINLSHPKIVRVFEVHPEYDSCKNGIIVSEFIDSPNLADLMLEKAFTISDAAWITIQLCSALFPIHKKGIVHREIKPQNILVERENLSVTLLDSGIARHANTAIDSFTKTGVFVGDLVYSAPEQTGKKIDHRADIYSVTVVLFEMVSGRKVPFPKKFNWEKCIDQDHNLPLILRDILKKGLNQSADLRYSSVKEMSDELHLLAPERIEEVPRKTVIALHGIRTHAAWQRTFSEVAGNYGLNASIDRWNFGFFSVLRFLMPWARLAKVRWFRTTYQIEFEKQSKLDVQLPSIVAHSFGTYILGNALLRYSYLRFDKILLCGSILPVDFPWDQLLERGQVQFVRNEYGSEDFWTKYVNFFVPGTGPSGLIGFSKEHPKLKQERFDFAHSEYFDRFHMTNRWIPYLSVHIRGAFSKESSIIYDKTGNNRPLGLYLIYIFFGALLLDFLRIMLLRIG
jgi:serine/threonine protein kinase